MKREEEIINAAKTFEKKEGFSPIVMKAKGVNSAVGIGFIEGAVWADNHPNELVSNDLEAEFVLYLKHKFHIPQEGNTLKTDGWSPSPYDLLDIAKHFAQWQKGKMIEKACEWLENHNDYQRVHDNGKGVRFDMTQCVIDFRKAMEE